MDIKMRMGTEKDIDSLGRLYDDLNEYLASGINYPGWKKGIYPTRQDAEDGIREGCLHVATEEGRDEIIGTIILRHKPEPTYLTVKWQADLDYEDVLVIHTFAVNPKWIQQGIGKTMLDFVTQYAEEKKVKALRLDVSEWNLPAIHLYERCGYHYIDTVSLGLEEFGLNWFRLYEKLT